MIFYRCLLGKPRNLQNFASSSNPRIPIQSFPGGNSRCLERPKVLIIIINLESCDVTSSHCFVSWKMNEQTKVGIGLLGCGAFFAFLGVILFFDRGLLALSNIFSFSGVFLLLGWQSTWQLFTKKMNYKGSLSFLVGLFLIFVRWPIVGIILEIYGILVVFRDFWPAAKTFLCHIPVVGWFLQYPFMLLDQLRRNFG